MAPLIQTRGYFQYDPLVLEQRLLDYYKNPIQLVLRNEIKFRDNFFDRDGRLLKNGELLRKRECLDDDGTIVGQFWQMHKKPKAGVEAPDFKKRTQKLVQIANFTQSAGGHRNPRTNFGMITQGQYEVNRKECFVIVRPGDRGKEIAQSELYAPQGAKENFLVIFDEDSNGVHFGKIEVSSINPDSGRVLIEALLRSDDKLFLTRDVLMNLEKRWVGPRPINSSSHEKSSQNVLNLTSSNETNNEPYSQEPRVQIPKSTVSSVQEEVSERGLKTPRSSEPSVPGSENLEADNVSNEQEPGLKTPRSPVPSTVESQSPSIGNLPDMPEVNQPSITIQHIHYVHVHMHINLQDRNMSPEAQSPDRLTTWLQDQGNNASSEDQGSEGYDMERQRHEEQELESVSDILESVELISLGEQANNKE